MDTPTCFYTVSTMNTPDHHFIDKELAIKTFHHHVEWYDNALSNCERVQCANYVEYKRNSKRVQYVMLCMHTFSTVASNF